MFVSNSREFIFLHIPKCGGESVTSTLSKSAKFIDLELGSTEKGIKLVNVLRPIYDVYKHSCASEVKHLLNEEWIRYKKFSICRNPYHRAVSLYKYFLAYPAHPPHQKFDLTSFSNFIRCKSFINGYYIAAAQHSFVDRSDISIFKLEELHEAWPRIARWLNIPFSDELVYRNKTSGEIEIVDEDRQQIYELWSEDFMRFDYPA